GGSSRRKSSKIPALIRIAATTPPARSLIVLFCLLGSGVAEGIGIASLIPLLVAAGNPAGANQTGIGAYILHIVQSIGLPTNGLILLVILVLGMVGKALLHLAAMRQVGHAVAEVGTHMRLRLVSALLDARWSFFVREPMGRFANALGMEAMRASE